MAKKTAAKKPARRMKKTVRRSMATVLMITAVVVAAIPVPENLAVTPGSGSRVTTTTIGYTPATDREYEANRDGQHGEQNSSGCSHLQLEGDGKLPNEFSTWLRNKELMASVKLGSIGGKPMLSWEFLYHPGGTGGRATLCKYNNEFPAQDVELDLVPIDDYHTVDMGQFEVYFSEHPDNYKSNLNMSINEMDNLGDSTDLETYYQSLPPNEAVQCTYHEWKSTNHLEDFSGNHIREFLDEYCHDDFVKAIASFEEYNAWEKNHEEGSTAPQLFEFTKKPRELGEAQKIRFYFQHNEYTKKNLRLDTDVAPTLEVVYDERIDADGNRRNGTQVYVIKGEAKGTGTAETYNGYLVERQSTENAIMCIGERAFKGVENIQGNIKISDQVSTIGNEAFIGCAITGVTMNNVGTIGNRAFFSCGNLTSVTLGPGVKKVGAEAFRNCTRLNSINFPHSMNTIGYGAFSACTSLASVNLSEVNSCEVKPYAFFDDTALNNVNFGDNPMSGVNILGDYCFAVTNAGVGLPLTSFTFPRCITGRLSPDGTGGEMGKFVLANRQSLSVVTMPDNYRGTIPSSTFYNCTGLSNVIFPETCIDAHYNPDMFEFVTNSDFFVRGPELSGDGPAEPRISTWHAATSVSGENGIPYVFRRGDTECYEVAMRSDDGSLYRYEANAEGELLSCVLIDRKGSVDIIIPSKVGNYAIKSIAEGCFSDETLRKIINSITIQNHSISRIDSRAFQGLENLKKVRIGDSVTEIGDDAFADCTVLTDVFFTKPAGGYQALSMADTAFATRGGKLTFHGDIDKNYRPFTWAMEKDRTLKDPEDPTAPDVNVCYQSLWDSETGTHLTVMRDRSSDDVVLLDYPKLTDLQKDNIRNDVELDEYCKSMERTYYYSVYGNDNATSIAKGKTVGELRREYALLLHEKREDPSANIDERIKAVDGPWINPNFCSVRTVDGNEMAVWESYLPTAEQETADAGQSLGQDLYDFFFEPLVVQAAQDFSYWLKPYFERNPYNFIENYERQPAEGEQLDLYQEVDERAMRFINGAKTIIVPDGITSIDVKSYAETNNYNYKTYITSADNKRRDTLGTHGSVAGLFSGYYQDYEDGKAEGRETDPRGNDVVERIVLTSVKKLPAYSFDNCELLESVTLGAVNEMGDLPFRGCRNMTEIVGNDKYPAEKGILFEKQDGDTKAYKIVECLMSKGNTQNGDEGMRENEVSLGTNTLLKDVTSIAKSAFEGCEYLSRVNLTGADGIKEIPEGCFKDCKSLTHVELPVSINKIKENSFEGVTSEGAGGSPVEVVIRGREVDIADSSFVPKDNVTIFSYADSAAERFAKRHNITFKTLDSYRVKFYDYDGKQIGKTQELARVANEDLYAKEPEEAQILYAADHRTGYKFTGEWRRYTSDGQIKTLKDPIEEDMTTFVAQYESDGSMVGGKYVVEFHDGVDGSLLSGRGSDEKDGKYYIDAGLSFKDKGWPVPTHKTQVGYEALGYSDNFSETTVIDRNMSVVLLYKAAPGGGSGNTSGGSTNTSGGSSNTSGGTTSGNSGNTSNGSSNNNSSSSSSSSTSSTSTTSGTSGAGQFTVFVENGSGSGTYTPGTTVIIQASIPAAGMRFDKWTTESNGVTLASVSMSATTFTMPSNNVTVKANYVADTTALTGTTGTGNNTTDTTGNGYTRVDIEKPGISNRDLATATTNGSTDNFIVKISETDEATRAVAAALTNKYGTLDNILYYAMDISLYDSTGTTKITDTTGLSVDITIPIPDSLVAYGGNNMAGAVINGDQLESLNESFTTINGVPCIRFRATHFSPYTIYVDTGNLVEGMLDVTPKTGDPIHPKWFLSLGLACLSMILFLKRDKKVAVKA